MVPVEGLTTKWEILPELSWRLNGKVRASETCLPARNLVLEKLRHYSKHLPIYAMHSLNACSTVL